jgi:Rps23 Pro-64 3,4-dihydroxylase Tpa1-like proline 4-hydroxylase
VDHVTKPARSLWLRGFRSRTPERLAEPPHCRITTFLPPCTAELILLDVVNRRSEFMAKGCRASGDPAFYRMTSPLRVPPEFISRFQELLPMLQRRFKTELRNPQIELLAHAYNDGSFFGRHSDVDAGGPNWQRRLSGIIYLHALPRKFEGGSLIIYDRHGRAHSIEPEHNSAVFFPNNLNHEVSRVSCATKAFEDSRFSINIWIS